jgi:pimeloyl-ACP methyl ester carboxylesterase
MEAITQLKNDLQLMLYPREIYERPRLNLLARYLAAEFERSHGNQPHQPSVVPAAKDKQPQIIAPSPHPLLSVSPKLPAIAFILSSPRSGSTLLRVMLAGHPELASPPELHLLPFNTMAEREKELVLSHLGEGLPRAFMDLQGIESRASQSLVAELVQQDCPIPEVYALLQKLAGHRLLVDKSPTYATHRATLERAEAIFAGAKYVHLVRHPYAVIESFCRLRMDKLVAAGDNDPYALAEAIWTDSNRNILDFCQQLPPERHHLVRYEDLVTKPRPVMEKLCQFLEVPFDEAVLTPYAGQRMTEGIHQQSLPIGDPNFLQHKQIESQLAENWQKIQLPRPLSSDARHIASSLAYELPQESAPDREDFAVRTPPISRQESYLNLRGLDLCLCSWGEESAPLILYLHGILEQGAAWQEVAVPLASRGYRVVAPDFRGHGRSAHVPPGCSYNLLDLLGDVDAIASQLAARPFILVGHSLGSLVAAMLASIRPEKVQQLVLVETVLPAEVGAGETAEQLAAQLDYLAEPPVHAPFPDVAGAAARLRLGTPALSESLAWELAERLTEPCPGGVRWRWDPRLRTRAGIGFNGLERDRYLSLLGRIQAPITLIYGDRSDFNRPTDLAAQQQAMPQAKRIVLAGGHNLHLEAPVELAKALIPDS